MNICCPSVTILNVAQASGAFLYKLPTRFESLRRDFPSRSTNLQHFHQQQTTISVCKLYFPESILLAVPLTRLGVSHPLLRSGIKVTIESTPPSRRCAIVGGIIQFNHCNFVK
jgi:hypothetical protein